MKTLRLQGKEWHDLKGEIKITAFFESDNGRIKVYGKHIATRKQYRHWLSPEEQKNFNKAEYKQIHFDKKGRKIKVRSCPISEIIKDPDLRFDAKHYL